VVKLIINIFAILSCDWNYQSLGTNIRRFSWKISNPYINWYSIIRKTFWFFLIYFKILTENRILCQRLSSESSKMLIGEWVDNLTVYISQTDHNGNFNYCFIRYLVKNLALACIIFSNSLFVHVISNRLTKQVWWFDWMSWF
jgi:hypothetical protein